MRTTKLSELPIIPEKYGKKFEPHFPDTDMVPDERLFISGLIQYYEPEKILEVGVAGGGGSANILNTILDMDASLTSIDIVEVFDHPLNGPVRVGAFVHQEFPRLPEGKWQLLTGKDSSERMEELDTVFDFLVLDTAHVHPVETFNFLSILPYLREDAIVILHDISIYMNVLDRTKNVDCFATRLLMSTVCAEKLLPDFTGVGGFTNIVAFQISSDTKKYLRNVFDSLMLPWEWFPDVSFLFPVGKFVERHYSEDLRKIFWKAAELNFKVYIVKEGKVPAILLQNMKKEQLIFYGAGNNMKKLLSLMDGEYFKFDFPIWDENADNIREICGHSVVKPDFVSQNKIGQKVIISIKNQSIFEDVCRKLEALDYPVFHGLWDYLMFCIKQSGDNGYEKI